MKGEKDPMLESDRLEELLEVPPPAQPVVVVEYRNRGVPSWVFFPLIFVVPLAAIVVYHRMVVERYRVQAAQANSLLEREIDQELASLPIVRNDPPPTTILPGTQERTTPIVKNDSPPATTLPAQQPPTSPTAADPFRALVDSPAVTATKLDPEKAKGSTPETPSVVADAPATGAPAQPAHAGSPVVAGAAPPAVATVGPPPAPEKTARITMRTILPNPFEDGTDPPRPPPPGDGGGPAPDVDNRVKSPAAPAQNVVEQTPGAGIGGQIPHVAAGESPDSGAVPVIGQSVAAARPVEPLPTKEESERQIREEAARREAEIRAQNDAKSAEVRAQRLAEQLKFRDELGELIRTQGKKAGPDIEALAKRYGYEYAPEKMAQAIHIWRLTRNNQAEKVRKVRALELPEAVVLGFLFDDIFRTAGGRNGPQNNGEVRVLAAQQLLRYPPPGAVKPARNVRAGDAASRSASPSRKTVVSTPR